MTDDTKSYNQQVVDEWLRDHAMSASIKHWEENLEKVTLREFPNIRSSDCALCKLYLKEPRHAREYSLRDTCGNCPIRIHTGKSFCNDTPYRLVDDTYDDLVHIVNSPIKKGASATLWDDLYKATKAELAFLRKVDKEMV